MRPCEFTRALWMTLAIAASACTAANPAGPDAVSVGTNSPPASSPTGVAVRRLWIRSCDPVPSGGTCEKKFSQEVTSAAATVEFLDGPLAGQTMTELEVSSLPPYTVSLPARVRLTARFYAPAVFVLTEATAFSVLPDDLSFVVPMNFVGSGSTDSYVNDTPHAVYRFNTKAAGQVEIGTYWSYYDLAHYVRVVTELWCDGKRLATGGDGLYGMGHSGQEFSTPVPAASACEVRVPESTGLYRLTITYQH